MSGRRSRMQEEADSVRKTIVLAALINESAKNQLNQWAKQIESEVEI